MNAEKDKTKKVPLKRQLTPPGTVAVIVTGISPELRMKFKGACYGSGQDMKSCLIRLMEGFVKKHEAGMNRTASTIPEGDV